MTRKMLEATRDCIFKIKDLTPPEEQIKEMFSLLSEIDRLSEICNHEGPSGLRLEADDLPESTPYEKAFKESILMWLNGASIDEASDHAADRYFEMNPSGYDAAICYAAVFGVRSILKDQHSYGFIDETLQYLLPDGWRWREEDEKADKAHKDDKDWFPLLHSHRKEFIGDHKDEIYHRYDDVKICDLLPKKDPDSVKIGKRIAAALPDYADGALQLIMKELTYPEIEKALYVLPEEAGDRIVANINEWSISIIKGDCILNKDTVDPVDIQAAVAGFEEAVKAYNGDKTLEAEYER